MFFLLLTEVSGVFALVTSVAVEINAVLTEMSFGSDRLADLLSNTSGQFCLVLICIIVLLLQPRAVLLDLFRANVTLYVNFVAFLLVYQSVVFQLMCLYVSFIYCL